MSSNSSPRLPINTGPTDITLLSELQRLDSIANYPATDLVKELLKFHKAETTHERNIHLSAQVFLRSRTVYEAINGLIKEVDEQQAEQELDYTKWLRYTDAIPPLEEILLQYSFSKPDKKRKHVPSEGEDVSDGLTFISIWEEDREMLKTTLNNLKKDTLEVLSPDAKAAISEAYDQHRLKDDSSTLSALYDYTTSATKLEDLDISDKKRHERPVTDVRSGIQEIARKLQSLPPNENSLEIAIKTFMIFAIPFSLLDKARPSTLKKLQPDIKEHLASIKVWKAMKSLVSFTLKVVERKPGPEQAPHLKTWAVSYEALRELLLEVAPVFISMVDEMLELIKLSAKIRSPFHERTIGLVKILRQLDIDTNKAAPDARRDLKKTMKVAVKELTTASTKINKDVKSVILSEPEYKSQATEINNLLSEIKQTSNTLNLGSKWPEAEELYTKGVKTDEDHLTRMRQVFMNAVA